MPRGGKRNGSGRPKGSPTKRRQLDKAKAQAASEGVEPLEVMLRAMRHYDQIGEMDKAAEMARHAAPYRHPRLAAVTLSGDADKPPIAFSLADAVAALQRAEKPPS